MTPVFRHGRLRLYLLRLLDEEPRHGYEVIRLLRDRFMGVYAPSPGTIYPRLARLEEEGLVTHDEENGRKVYRITEAGRAELRSRGAELDELEAELSASVSDIVREVREDVRDTVRSLREELTRAARDMRRTEKDAVRDTVREAKHTVRDTAREAKDAVRDTARGAKNTAKDAAREAREAAEAAREQSRGQGLSQPRDAGWAQSQGQRLSQARDEALNRAQRLREDAAHLHDAGSWGEWGRWTEWPSRAGWPGPHDMAALRDLERLARDFVADLRGVAWDSGALLGSEVIPTLRDILEDTLNRIRTEVLAPRTSGGSANPSAAPGTSGTPGAPGASAPTPMPAPKDSPETPDA
jgi:DNA-binding PadR family transcriptional regulator